MRDKVFSNPIEKKFEFDVKSVSKQQLLVVCSFGTGVVPDQREEMPLGCGTKWSHRGLLSDDGILG
jgi:hypothetical protein